MPSTWPACSGGPPRRGRSSSTSATLASKTSPKPLISRESASSPQCATGTCSVSVARSLLGNSRRTTALRTQGTDSKAARAFARSTVKKLPASCGATLARSVTALLCVTSPSTLMPASGKKGWRSTHQAPAASSTSANNAYTRVAVTFMSLTSKGTGMLSLMAGLFRPSRNPAWRRPARAGTSPRSRCLQRAPTWEPANGVVMPGEVFISSRKGLRSLARIIRSARPQPRQPSWW